MENSYVATFKSEVNSPVFRIRRMISKWALNQLLWDLGIQQRNGSLGLELHALAVSLSVESVLILVFHICLLSNLLMLKLHPSLQLSHCNYSFFNNKIWSRMAILCISGSCFWTFSLANMDSWPILSGWLQQKVCIVLIIFVTFFILWNWH